MKTSIFTLLFFITGLLIHSVCFGQCTPGDSISCPDYQSDGEICPETLPDVIVNQLYMEEVTIIAPPEYILDTVSGSSITLHHLEIVDITNGPEGMTWDCNAEDDILMVGTYYCFLLEGTPTTIGHYPIKIIIDVYIPGILGSPPLYIATLTDSTSLSMEVIEDPFGIPEDNNSFNKVECLPNPFKTFFDLSFYSNERKKIDFELFNLLGKKVHTEEFITNTGENHFIYDGSDLPSGIYIYSISDEQQRFTKRIIKSN